MAKKHPFLQRTSWSLFRFFAVMLLVATSGCGGAPTAHVTGTVTLDSKPLSTGTVTFYPTTAGLPAYGEIDTTGHYEMHIGDETGLAPGEYQVAVVANEPVIMPTGDGMPMPGKSLLPFHYGSVQESGLIFTAAAGDQVHDIALTSTSP